MNLLFTCAGRRTYLLKYFREQLGDQDKIFATDMQLNAPALSVADVKLQVPGVYDSNYINKLLEICRTNKIDAIISLNDLELPILSLHKKEIEETGAKIILSSPEVIDISFDKFKTFQFIEGIGLNAPKTYINLQDVLQDLDNENLNFPLILKPRWGSGSIGLEIVNNKDELIDSYKSLQHKIKKSILSTASIGEEYIIFQEYIIGQEYGLDIMNDLQGKNRGVSVKKKLAMRAGETDKAQTVDEPELRKIGNIIGTKLKHVGNLDVDIFEKDGNYYVLELNPRFGGGFPFSYEAGVNFPKAIIEWLKGNDINDTTLIPKYGKTYAKCDYLVNVD